MTISTLRNHPEYSIVRDAVKKAIIRQNKSHLEDVGDVEKMVDQFFQLIIEGAKQSNNYKILPKSKVVSILLNRIFQLATSAK
jgi:hypothetical protein